jgi:hypothetical protein
MRSTILAATCTSLCLITPSLAAPPTTAAPTDAPPAVSLAANALDDTPEVRWASRFPQAVKVGDLIGLPVLDDDDVTLGHVAQVVRSPEGKIRLIVSYSRWFGWLGRPVAVPIEVVAILGRQIDSIDMEPPDYAAAPTWIAGTDAPLAASDTVRIALGRR